MQITDLPDSLHAEAIDLWRECGLTRPWNDPAADLDRALAAPNATVLAAIEAGALIGTAMVGHDGHRGWVYYLATRPDRQGEGVGRALMLACERWLTERGAPKIQFMVRSDNSEVLAFYEHLGYQRQDVAVLGRRLDQPGQ